jgi:hypothetical protein
VSGKIPYRAVYNLQREYSMYYGLTIGVRAYTIGATDEENTIDEAYPRSKLNQAVDFTPPGSPEERPYCMLDHLSPTHGHVVSQPSRRIVVATLNIAEKT